MASAYSLALNIADSHCKKLFRQNLQRQGLTTEYIETNIKKSWIEITKNMKVSPEIITTHKELFEVAYDILSKKS